MKKTKKIRRSTRGLATLDHFLKDEGKLEEFEAVAIEEVLASKPPADDELAAAERTG